MDEDAREFNADEQPICPNTQCQEKLEGVASDYVPYGGHRGEEHTCPECECRYLAARQKDGKIRFELIEEDEDEDTRI